MTTKETKQTDPTQWGDVPFIDYVNAVDDVLEDQYGMTSDNADMEQIAAAQEAGDTPAQCVQWLAEYHGRAHRIESDADGGSEPKVPLGQILITPGVGEALNAADVIRALKRHQTGDWGDVDEEDARENERSLEEGLRLLSVYRSGATTFWVLTEADRSATTVLLPEEY